MARPSEKDPLDKFRWSVSIEGFTKLGFTSCETPSYSVTENQYAEGGRHHNPVRIVDSIDYRPVTLTRGVTNDRSFHDWCIQMFNLVRGTTPTNDSRDYHRDIVIEHLNRTGQAVKKYTLFKAKPIEYKPASDFSADGDDVLSMEKLVLSYESFQVETSGQESDPGNVKDIAKRLIRRSFF